MRTRLQFDETAQHLQKLENATRRAVCAAVKEFNKTQVCPGSVWRGGRACTRYPGWPAPPVPAVGLSSYRNRPDAAPAPELGIWA